MTDEMRTVSAPRCHFCRSEGQPLYHGLRDVLFGAQGTWHFRVCSNPSCMVLWLDPMPMEEDIGRAYRNYLTHTDRPPLAPSASRRAYQVIREGYWAFRYGYGREVCPLWKRLLGVLLYLDPPRRAHADFSVMYLPAHPSGRLLDYGCGSGVVAESLKRRGWTVKGIDMDADAVSNARRKGLDVDQGTLEGMHYPDSYFDAIVMSHVIEHVHDPVRLVQECRRILAPGGRLALVTPNARSLGHRMFKQAWRGLEPPRHLHLFTPLALKRLLDQAGFRTVTLTTSIRDAEGIFGMSRSIQKTGAYVFRTRQARLLWAWAKSMQMIEWAAMKVQSDLGEELVLVAMRA